MVSVAYERTNGDDDDGNDEDDDDDCAGSKRQRLHGRKQLIPAILEVDFRDYPEPDAAQ